MLVAIFALCGFSWKAWQRKENAQNFVQSSTITLFFHGGGSSYHAEEHMVNAAKAAGVTDDILIAFVDANGHVKLQGEFKKAAKNPIVMVNFENSRNFNFSDRGKYASNVVRALREKYTFQRVNMVGHSAGNIAVIYYMLQSAQDESLPPVHKYVAIAGHFAGLDFDWAPDAIKQPKGLQLDEQGKPNIMNATYQEMAKLRTIYPEGVTSVLNLIGDIGGKTDGTVPNVSSLSLKYLIADRAKSYAEQTFTGKKAKHSLLHENPDVDKVLIDFLWGK